MRSNWRRRILALLLCMVTLLSRSNVVVQAEDMPEFVSDEMEETIETPDDESEEAKQPDELETDIVESEEEVTEPPVAQETEQESEEIPAEEENNQQTEGVVEEQPDGENKTDSELPEGEETDTTQENGEKTDTTGSEDNSEAADPSVEDEKETDPTVPETEDQTDNTVVDNESKTDSTISENTTTEDNTVLEKEDDTELNKTEELQPDTETVTEEELPKEETNTEEQNTEEIYSAKYEDAQVIIYAEAEKEALPEGAELSVTPIIQTDITDDLSEEDRIQAEKINTQYDLTSQSLEKEAEDRGEAVTGFVAYDICFLLDGEKVEPTQKIDLTMEFQGAVLPDDTEEVSDITVYHLTEDAEEEDGIKTEELTEDATISRSEENNGIEKAELTADSFSILAFARTVIADHTYTAEYRDDRVVVRVEAAEGVVPEGAELSVTPVERIEITEDMSEEEAEKAEALNEQYDFANQKLSEEAQAKDKVVTGFVAYDICFLVEGEEVEPNGQVKVTMEFIDAVLSEEKAEDSSVSLYHFKEVAEEEDGIQVENLTEGAVIQSAEESVGVEKVEVTMDSFSLAAISREASPQPLTEAEGVVDTSEYITINMVNYEGTEVPTPFSPNCDTNTNYILTQDLLEHVIEEGATYPKFNDRKNNWGESYKDTETNKPLAGTSLGNYFADYKIKPIKATNGLFFKDAQTGYFHFASSENGVSFNPDNGRFTVYEELTTPISAENKVYGVGNFLPFNTFDKNLKSGFTNQYNTDFEELPDPDKDKDSRKGEPLYLPVGGPDYHFGMEILTRFYQRKDGKDEITGENGEKTLQDTEFRFTGDDDLWIYIDGVLVLDLGGCHRAMSGSINFATGVVTECYESNGYDTAGNLDIRTKTLKGIFEAAKVADRTTWKGNTFADFTTHDFKMWYMERGASASNLKVDFNLAIIPKEQIKITKQLEGTENQEYMSEEEFSFRVKAQKIIKTDSTGKETYSKDDKEEDYICLKDNIVDANGNSIQVQDDGIFKLKNGETAVIGDLQQDRLYYVEEILSDTEKFSEATIYIKQKNENGEDITSEGEKKTPTEGNIIKTDPAPVGDSKEIIFANQCVTHELKIKKSVDNQTELPSQANAKFTVTVEFKGANGAWLKYGGKYKVGEEEKNAVDGKIEISKDQTAILPGLVKGMEYRLYESDQGGYTEAPVYSQNGTTIEAVPLAGTNVKGITGTIPGGDIGIEVTNANLKDIHITKKWVDNQNALLKRPDSITVQLEYRPVGSSSDSDWKIYDKDQQHPNGEWQLTPASGQENAQEWSHLTIQGLPSKYEYRVTETKVGNVAVEDSSYTLSVIGATTKGTGENNHIYTSSLQNSLTWQMVKCSSTDHSVTLQGAEFDLLEGSQCIAKGESGTDGVIEWTFEGDNTRIFDWTTLKKGTTYTISETKARPGYALTSWTITMEDGFPTSIKDGEGKDTPTNKEDTNNPIAVFYLENEVLYELPSTGGTGIFGYMFSGVLLMIAGVLFLYKRKYVGRC